MSLDLRADDGNGDVSTRPKGRYSKFTCKQCGYVAFHRGHFQDHINTHIRKQFCCKTCCRKFTRGRDALRHLRVSHNIEDSEENLDCYFSYILKEYACISK